MREEDFVDRVVRGAIDLLGLAGFNGTRLKWRWNNYRSARAEAAAEREVRRRAITGRHKMCPSCRSLVAVGASSCPECGEGVAHVRGPGLSRLFESLLPGVSPVTAALLAANLLIFGVMAMGVGGSAEPGAAGLGRLLRGDGAQLARWGWGYGPWISGRGETWRLLTPLFLHAGILHLLFNCFALLQIGPLIEEEYGAAKAWSLYLLGGICGGVASNFLRPALTGRSVPYVGASGAIFALVGIALVFGWRRGGVYGDQVRRLMMRWALYALIYGVLLRADNFAHLGGFAGGMALAMLVRPAHPRGAGAVWLWRVAAWAGVAAVVWAFFMAGAHGMDVLRDMG